MGVVPVVGSIAKSVKSSLITHCIHSWLRLLIRMVRNSGCVCNALHFASNAFTIVCRHSWRVGTSHRMICCQSSGCFRQHGGQRLRIGSFLWRLRFVGRIPWTSFTKWVRFCTFTARMIGDEQRIWYENSVNNHVDYWALTTGEAQQWYSINPPPHGSNIQT